MKELTKDEVTDNFNRIIQIVGNTPLIRGEDQRLVNCLIYVYEKLYKVPGNG